MTSTRNTGIFNHALVVIYSFLSTDLDKPYAFKNRMKPMFALALIIVILCCARANGTNESCRMLLDLTKQIYEILKLKRNRKAKLAEQL